MSVENQKKIARTYIESVGKKEPAAVKFAAGCTAWAPSTGDMPIATYLDKVSAVGQVFSQPLKMTLHDMVAENGIVMARAASAGVLQGGQKYDNNYFFLIRFNDADEITHVTEFFDTRKAFETLIPVITAFREKQKQS